MRIKSYFITVLWMFGIGFLSYIFAQCTHASNDDGIGLGKPNPNNTLSDNLSSGVKNNFSFSHTCKHAQPADSSEILDCIAIYEQIEQEFGFVFPNVTTDTSVTDVLNADTMLLITNDNIWMQ